jgi:GT2 family glycosyltransferase
MSAAHSFPKVSIILLHLDNIECLLDCIDSLNEVSYPNFDIIIVHNGPKNETLLKTLNPVSQHIREIIDTGENIGFAKANNIGMRKALQHNADYVLLLNDDTVVAEDFLTILVNAGEENNDAGMLGPYIFFHSEPEKIWFAGARFDERSSSVTFPRARETVKDNTLLSEEADFITGCAVLAKKKTIEKIGLLDERFFIYWEDTDWGLRVKKTGQKNLVVPQAKIWHKVSVSTGGQESPRRIYLKTRSHFLLTRLHAPKAKGKLIIKAIRDVAWLLLKSKDPNSIKKALAYFTAIKDHYLEKTDRGPSWLWRD